jgi:hypothetical protein
MPWEPTERVGLPSDEKAKQDRRLIRAIKAGMCITQLQKSYGATEARVKKLAEEHGLTIKRGNGGNRL